MKPWQVDRALMHLKQAGKFDGVQGLCLGIFRSAMRLCLEAPTVREVCGREFLGRAACPIVYGAPVGHTPRANVDGAIGSNGTIESGGEGELEILEPAVVP